jgi:hypothetical protein
MVNFLALLGWNPGPRRRCSPPPSSASRFSLDRVQKKSAVFDPAEARVAERAAPGGGAGGGRGREVRDAAGRASKGGSALSAEGGAWFRGLVALLKVRARTVTEIAEVARIYTAMTCPWMRTPRRSTGFGTRRRRRGISRPSGRHWRRGVDVGARSELEVVVRGVAEARGWGPGS